MDYPEAIVLNMTEQEFTVIGAASCEAGMSVEQFMICASLAEAIRTLRRGE